MQITQSSIFNAFIDGILVVSPEGKIISCNNRFMELWQIPDAVFASKSDEKALQYVALKLANPKDFFDRVTYLYANPDEKSFDEVKLNDGRIFDRYSSPIADEFGFFVMSLIKKKLKEKLSSNKKLLLGLHA